jgi:hypothetical protein
LEKLLLRFEPELAGRGALLPPPAAHDQEFFNLMAHLLMCPEGLPDQMNEAIHAVNEMSTSEGLERLEQMMELTGAAIPLDEESSHGDLALQVWLADPALLTRARNVHRLSRLATFHHFGCKIQRPAPSDAALRSVAALERKCDEWFARHNRGRHNTRIDMYVLPQEESSPANPSPEPEYWFLIRHGDIYTRTAKVEKGKLDALHFRPARDDVSVFNPGRGEIRISAKTLGERDLYRAAFGEHIFGDPEAFSERKRYTLLPLTIEGEDALDTHATPGLCKAILRGVEIALPGPAAPRVTCKAADVFGAVRHDELPSALPPGAELTQAWIDLYLEDVRLPRPIQLRPPNTLRLSRQVPVGTVERWLAERGFRTTNSELRQDNE